VFEAVLGDDNERKRSELRDLRYRDSVPPSHRLEGVTHRRIDANVELVSGPVLRCARLTGVRRDRLLSGENL